MTERVSAEVQLAAAAAGRPVHFLLRPGMRDRHFDTVRRWTASTVLNASDADGRVGAQVTARDVANASFRGGFARKVPLINLKQRPPRLPKDTVLYTWGAIPMRGPFMVELDNPYALTAYNIPALRLFAPVLRRILLAPRCAAIVCMSAACREGLRFELGDAVATKALVRYPYMALPSTATRTAVGLNVRFLYVATQFEMKGGSALLRAWERVVVNAPQAELTVITHLPQPWRERAAHMKGLTVVPATLRREEIAARYMSAADVLVHPTYFDSFGMVVLEAMAHGLALITTDLYALPELVEDGVNGRILKAPISPWNGVRPTRYYSNFPLPDEVAQMDVRSFEHALADVLGAFAIDPQMVARMRTASLELFASRFAPNESSSSAITVGLA